MIDLNKLARLRELYALHLKYLEGKQEIIRGTTVTIFPHPLSEESRKQNQIDNEIEDLLWELLPEIIA